MGLFNRDIPLHAALWNLLGAIRLPTVAVDGRDMLDIAEIEWRAYDEQVREQRPHYLQVLAEIYQIGGGVGELVAAEPGDVPEELLVLVPRATLFFKIDTGGNAPPCAVMVLENGQLVTVNEPGCSRNRYRPPTSD